MIAFPWKLCNSLPEGGNVMNDLFIALYVLGGMFLLYAVLWVVLFGPLRDVVRERYEWLCVLKYPEWGTAAEIALQMQRLKGTHKRLLRLAILDLNDLCKEGLIESKRGDTGKGKVFRLTLSGIKRKDMKVPHDLSFF